MEEDRLGMRIQSETVEVKKDERGLVGITIGGGYPYCPCVYVVQIIDASSAATDGRIRCGDEIVAINGINVKGEKKQSVASLIQCSTNPVKITINKLEADSAKGKTVDIMLKKVKHKIVEFMDADSADALGLSRAILCNDPLLKKMKILENNADLYRNLIQFFTDMIYYQDKLNNCQKVFGDVFCELAAHESQQNANEVFSIFGDVHRQLEKRQNESTKQLRPMVADLETYVNKVIPDTQLTVKKYLDVKYEYLSYCLKLKELDDEEAEFQSVEEPLYRVETGNYEYRLMLRCRHDTRQKFVQMRNDVIVKIELLDQKHVRDIASHLTNFANIMKSCQTECSTILEKTVMSPIEIDLAKVHLHQEKVAVSNENNVEPAEEAVEMKSIVEPDMQLLKLDDDDDDDDIVQANNSIQSEQVSISMASRSGETFDLIDIR